jgi:hypothetical protein
MFIPSFERTCHRQLKTTYNRIFEEIQKKYYGNEYYYDYTRLSNYNGAACVKLLSYLVSPPPPTSWIHVDQEVYGQVIRG